MNRLCTCTGGAGVVVLASIGLAVIMTGPSSGLGPVMTGACCFTNDANQPDNPLFGDCTVTDAADCLTLGIGDGVYQGNDTDCSECSQNNCLKLDTECQEPNIGEFPGGTILTAGETYDNFIAGESGTVASICFWGAYIAPDPDGNLNGIDCDAEVTDDVVTITFYDNESSIPPFPADTNADNNPDPIATINVSVGAGTLAKRATGVDFQLGGFGSQPVTEFEFNTVGALAGAPTLVAGTCYWIRVENVVTSANPDCAFFWEVSPEIILDDVNGDGDDFSQGGVDDGAGGTAYFPNSFDMAWCIDLDLASLVDDDITDGGCFQEINAACVAPVVAPGEGSCVILSGDPLLPDVCAVGTAAFCSNAGGDFTEGASCLRDCNSVAYTNPFTDELYSGCLDPACCTLVCDGDDANPDLESNPLCCQIGWDQTCADIAVFDQACASVPLCQPSENCQAFAAGLAFFAATDPSGVNGDQFVPADDFTPAATGTITSLCWYGHFDPGDSGIGPNAEVDDFTVVFYEDNDGLPGAVLRTYTQADLDTATVTKTFTNTNFGVFPINEYDIGDLSLTAQGGVPVDAGNCYWISIENGQGGFGTAADPASWLWHTAIQNSSTAPYYSGNGRLADDAADANGNVSGDYDVNELIGGADLAFCLDIELSDPACGLDSHWNAGPERIVFFDSGDAGNFGSFFLGWSSGMLCSPDCPNDEFPERRTAQPFTIPQGPGPTNDLRIRQIFVDGFAPDGVLNEEFHYEVFARNGQVRPTEADSLITASIPYGAAVTGLSHPEHQGIGSGIGSSGALHSIHTDFNLPPGDYWLTVWATNASNLQEGGQTTASNFAWFTNAERALDLTCQPEPWPDPTPEDEADPSIIGCNDADPMYPPVSYMWRARHWPPLPDGYGFGSYSLDPTTTLTTNPNLDPPTDPADLHSANLMVRGTQGDGFCGNSLVEAGEDCDDGNNTGGDGCSAICKDEAAGTCIWDCVGNDGIIGIDEFLAILGTWGSPGPCDYDGSGAVGIEEFLKVLGTWGTCP